MRKPLAIIGMSPGNSYFKDYEVRYLLQQAMDRFGRCAVVIADVPAISTYIAFGYTPQRARSKAIMKGNNLKNRTRRIAEELGYNSEQVRIVDWAAEVETDSAYQVYYRSIEGRYNYLPAFAEAVRRTTKSVLDNGGQVASPSEIEQASHYLLSEIAFMEFAPEFFNEDRVCYIYHRSWEVYEDYIRGHFDSAPKAYLDFLLLEAPYETYVKLNDEEEADTEVAFHDTHSRVLQSGVLRAAYNQYPPIMTRGKDGEFSGVFYEIIMRFAEKLRLQVKWVEETGYGVVIDGLAAGRFDIFCSPAWPTPERKKHAALSHPVYYSDVGVWVRKDSDMVGQDWLHLNDPGRRIAITENDVTHAISMTDFVRARWVRMPQLAQVKGLLDAVADGRADATMVERMTAEAFAGQLSSPLVNLAAEKPIRRFANCFLVGKNQNDFLDLIDRHIADMLRQDQVRPLLEKYLPQLNGIYLARPYNA